MQNLTLEEGKNIESLNPDLFFLKVLLWPL